MKTDELKAIARRWHDEVWNIRAIDVIDEIVDPHYVNHSAKLHGIDQLKRLFESDPGPRRRVVDEDVIADAEAGKVALRWRWMEDDRVTHRGITILRIADGRIVEDWFSVTAVDD